MSGACVARGASSVGAPCVRRAVAAANPGSRAPPRARVLDARRVVRATRWTPPPSASRGPSPDGWDPIAPPSRAYSNPYALDIDDAQVRPGGVELTPRQTSVLDAFWVANGVRSASHRRALTRAAATKGLFRDPERLLDRMAELEDALWRAVGIPEIDMGVVVGRFPKALYFEPDFLVERLRLLRDLLPGVNLRRVIERNPQVLTMDMTCTLPAKMRELSVLLPHTDVIHLIETHPKILSVNVSTGVSRNLAELKSMLRDAGVVEQAVEVMVAHNPRLLTSDVRGTVRARMELLEEASPGATRRYGEKPASLSRMLCASERAIDRVAYVRAFHPDDARTKSEIRTVNLPTAKFEAMYPEFGAWQRKVAAARSANKAKKTKKTKKDEAEKEPADD